MSNTGNYQYSAAWEQFLIGKRTMLAEYEQARAHSRQLKVQTFHGVAAESIFRDWLASFLPKRFGVTAGYIRGQRLRTPYDYAHFDVIIYDQIASPMLWLEASKDKSESGRARIVPAEHVFAVLEVKATLTRESVKAAAEKLHQLEPLMRNTDHPDERYPTYLPERTVLGMVFFELQRNAATDVTALEIIRDLTTLQRDMYGAIVLSGEGHHIDDTGLIRLTVSDTPLPSRDSNTNLLNGVSISETREIKGKHFGAIMMWSDIQFSEFAFDLLAIMNGTFRIGSISSWHGIDLSKFPSPD
jgi:hypothetical protein